MQKLAIIVADRDAGTAAEVRAMVGPQRYDVVEVTDPDQLIPAMKDHERRVILIAQSQAGFDSSIFRKENAEVIGGHFHIIAMLDDHSPDAVAAAVDAGANDTISRPLVASKIKARLRQADRIVTLEEFRAKFENESRLLAELAARTSFHSRRYLQAQLEHEIARARRFAHALSVILTEVKSVSTDDRTMRTIGHLLFDRIRARVDWVARYDDRVFAMVLPETGLDGARRAAERLHTELLDDVVQTAADLPGHIVVNSGVSTLETEDLALLNQASSQGILVSAERYLRDAEKSGPNRIAGGVQSA